MDLMLDLETLGVGSDCVVLSIGACFFDPEINQIGSKFDCFLKVQEQLDIGRKIDYSTLQWWIKQDVKAKTIFSKEGTPVKMALDILSKFMEENKQGKLHIWGNGSNFDIGILDSLYKDFGVKIPWSHTNIMDFRTYRRFVANGRKIEKSDRIGVHHDALSDAISQAQFVIDNYKKV